MKKLLFTLLFGAILSAYAQIEVKINPVMTALGMGDISGEYLLSETFGAELSLQPYFGKSYGFSNPANYVGKQSGFAEKIRAKYYYSPYNGGDRQYVDIFAINLSTKTTRNYLQTINNEDVQFTETYKLSYTGIGFEYGFKNLRDSGIFFEYALGLGVFISSEATISSDPKDPSPYSYNALEDVPVFFSGKFAIGYRFGE